MYDSKVSAMEGHRSALKFVNTGSGAVFIFTSNAFLEQGIMELATHYFVAPWKSLCILDSASFDTPARLKEYLNYIQTLNDDLNVIVINERLSNCTGSERYCPWVCGTSITKQAFIKLLMSLSAAKSNINEVLSFYHHGLDRQRFNMTQSIIMELMMQGLSVNEISLRMDTSPKTVYSSLRQICIAHNQRTIFHLMHFFRQHQGDLALYHHQMFSALTN
ncbi:Uncharacterised protein [Cedecea neteri]|uniref:Uncharacterized protein n=1 Tax=Cedecea neteri TaxID=158822 RepID=A0A291E3M1_9ENTR|nr:LuxR C-terminal-related transcriptional regulator [Cedecea neteri]ATF94522.1 hypothetical protein CO704_21720 [Cedecea neteri]SQA97964.1 Uncharacterised protein [Cedecea neteri]